MIISASRRTDIPAFYSEWLMNRLKEGYALVPNPQNPLRFSRVSLAAEVVDCIVFWTKNPAPMLPKLGEITAMGYPFYFQFTLTPYGRNIEKNLPDKQTLLQTFQTLSCILGPERVVWRYDPVIITEQMNVDYHLQCFEALASALEGYTHRCTISFLDFYPKLGRSLQEIGAIEARKADVQQIAGGFSKIAQRHNLHLFTCCEPVDLSQYGVSHASCIDGKLIEEILNCSIYFQKDKNQRPGCGCMQSVELGSYDCCTHGCKYCYATSSAKAVQANALSHHPQAPVLFGDVPKKAIIIEKQMFSVKDGQIEFF